MDRNRYQQIREVFHEAFDLTGAARGDFLDRACGDDDELRTQVETLLRLDENATHALLDHPEAFDALAEGALAAPASEPHPRRVNNYTIVRQIGEGGMGMVYEARQESPVKRDVALKLIKPGMDSREVVARFAAERQALAKMEHPGIATVLDAGTAENGRPYFVMELVRGTPISRFCDEHQLPLQERLTLFIDVCYAVQHAHVKGIIHRDLKPTNILVEVIDGRPRPKVIDFGVAKAFESDDGDRTAFTQLGQLVGTPMYMSPEQTKLHASEIDTRTDIYSLGVILYELLTGSQPFESSRFKSAGMDEMQRIIREEDPQRPSTRLARSGKNLSDIARARVIEPGQLIRWLRGDLDWIVMKTLEKDRELRYATTSELAQDVRRFLDDEPTLARPPGAAYRLKKFVRRNRTAVTAGSIVMAAVILGLVLSLVGLVQAGRQRALAEDNAELLRRELYVSRIERIEKRLRYDEPVKVKQLLDMCDGDLRGWEWDRLNWLADRSVDTTTTSREAAHRIAFSADGTKFAIIRGQNKLELWNPTTMTQLRSFHAKGGCHALAISQDGSLVALGEASGDIRVWDADTGRELVMVSARSKGHVISIGLDAVHRRLAVGFWLGGTQIWDIDSGERTAELDAPLARSTALSFSRDGTRLLSASLLGPVAILDVARNQPISVDDSANTAAWDADFMQGEQRTASVDHFGNLWVRDLERAENAFNVDTEKVDVRYVAVDPDGLTIAVGGQDGIVTLFDAQSGERRDSLHGHDANISGLAYSTADGLLYSCDVEGRIKRWRTDATLDEFTWRNENQLLACAWSSDGNRLYLGGFGSGLRALNTATGEVDVIETPIRDVVSIGTGRAGKRLALCGTEPGGDIGMCVIELDDGRARWLNKVKSNFVDLSRDELRVCLVDDGSPRIYDAVSGEPLLSVDTGDDPAIFAVFTPDGRRIVTSHPSGTLRVTNALPGNHARPGDAIERFTVSTDSPARLAFNRAGDRLAVIGADGRASIVDWRSSRELVALDLYADSMARPGPDAGTAEVVRFSPDGRRIITCGQDFTIRLMDAATGNLLFNVGRHRSPVEDVGFSPDGRTLASVGRDHMLRIWYSGPPPVAKSSAP